MNMMTDCVQITTTAAEVHTLEHIARELVGKRLAACVQIAGPVTSIYRWQGVVEQSVEWTCEIKTTAGQVESVVACIGELHSYDTPQVIVTPVLGGSRKYLDWLADQVDSSPTS